MMVKIVIRNTVLKIRPNQSIDPVELEIRGNEGSSIESNRWIG